MKVLQPSDMKNIPACVWLMTETSQALESAGNLECQVRNNKSYLYVKLGILFSLHKLTFCLSWRMAGKYFVTSAYFLNWVIYFLSCTIWYTCFHSCTLSYIFKTTEVSRECLMGDGGKSGSKTCNLFLFSSWKFMN